MRHILLTPGPTPLPPEILEILSKPIIHHRTSEFKKILNRVRGKIKKVFFTDSEVLIFASSGTGAMEAAVTNFFKEGDKVLVIEGGKFGQRWSEICKSFRLQVLKEEVEWGKSLSKERLSEILDSNPDIKGVFSTLCETSTGTVFDIKGYGELLKDKECLLIVDAISGLASEVFYQDEWGVDIVVSASQKGLMLPPGLGFLSFSKKAEKFLESSDLPKYYFDVKKYYKTILSDDTPFTPAINLVIALDKALDILLEEGMENVFKKFEKMSQAVRKAISALGLKLFSESPSQSVTAVISPVDSVKLVNLLRTKYKVSIAGGQAYLKGKIFRIAHMGYISYQDLFLGFLYLEKALKELGFEIKELSSINKLKEYM